MSSLERVNIRMNVRTYSHTYVRDRPYIPSTTLLCEGIIIKKTIKKVVSRDYSISIDCGAPYGYPNSYDDMVQCDSKNA